MADDNSFTIPNLIDIQMDRLGTLKQMFANFKKDPVNRKTKSYFKLRIERLTKLHEEFTATHKEIVCSSEKENDYFKNRITFVFEETYFEFLCTVTEAQETLHPDTASTAASSAQQVMTTSSNATSVKLPNLPVPTFTGKFIDWPGFHDSFNRLIHLNPDLNAMQKFHFLRKALPIDRDVDIHQMPLTEDNYLSAWQFLLKRYNNPRILFMHHMNTLFNIPILHNERSEDIKSLLNIANLCVNAFKRLKIPIDQCDHWLAFYLSTKLPKETHKAWELSQGNNVEIPSFSLLSDFLHSRLFTLDAIENRTITHQMTSNSFNEKHIGNQPSHSKSYKRQSAQDAKCFHVTAQTSNQVDHCAYCSKNHIIRRCPAFLAKDCYERKAIVDAAKVCLNCLSKTHTVSKCTSIKNCMVNNCGQRHHSLLHFPTVSSKTAVSVAREPATILATEAPDSAPVVSANAAQCSIAAHDNRTSFKVLLATALVTLINPDTGLSCSLRALVDQGSEGTIISEHAVQTLGLTRRQTSAQIAGVGPGVTNRCRYVVSFQLCSKVNPNFKLFVNTAYVLNTLTHSLPSQSLRPPLWPHIQGLPLADPTFNKSSKIDIIIGVDLFAEILLPDVRIGTPGQLIAQNSHLGWILSGKVTSSEDHSNPISITCHHSKIELDGLIQRFFELDQVPMQKILSAEDAWCETFFKKTHTRQSSGKYMVRLPFKSLFDSQQVLGKSRQGALNRFHHLERRLNQNNELRTRYHSAIQEYFELNQIVEAKTTEAQHTPTSDSHSGVTSCVLAHHAVVKEDSLTTKVRIVFDASAKTSNGRSLNDVLCVGPPLQNDLPAVILNWRVHQYVFVADIQRMYRCIDMHPDDYRFQRILWRNNEGHIQDYCLTTVTFGTASAPYTAIRVLHQLADDEKSRFPLAEPVLKHDMYVDDVQTGSYSIESAIEIRDQLIAALLSAGMELRKWSSNSPLLLQGIPDEHRSCNILFELNNNNEMVKTLGMYWQPSLDEFRYKVNFEINTTSTKRAVLSTVARLFDPLGLITPVVVAAKLILKQIHSVKITHADNSTTMLGWDDEIPKALNAQWQQFLNGLSDIGKISLPRWIEFKPDTAESIELHAFSDGSSSAYAANVYMRIKHINNCEASTHLLISKSRVTPTKPLTIPEIELCGALLATKLLTWVKDNLRLPHNMVRTFYWTDATIVLYWINGDINRWKVFVANRISQIQQHSSAHQWGHVPTHENPADCATRGLTPAQLASFDLWWRGPSWLHQPAERWPKFNLGDCDIDDTLTHAKPVRIHTQFIISKDSLIHRYSSLNKLVRVTAFISRFHHNCLPSRNKSRLSGPITVKELQQSLQRLVLLVQKETFYKERVCIESNQPLPNKSKLVSLTPFLDDAQLLRVRGRLQRTSWTYTKKHPMILPNDHFLTELIINNAHLNTLHGGVQLTLANTRQQFWIVNGRQTVRRLLRKCVICFRNKPNTSSQLMGNLPHHRVNPPTRAFAATGVDYTGAIELKASKYRGNFQGLHRDLHLSRVKGNTPGSGHRHVNRMFFMGASTFHRSPGNMP